jgi:hypothetical protein
MVARAEMAAMKAMILKAERAARVIITFCFYVRNILNDFQDNFIGAKTFRITTFSSTTLSIITFSTKTLRISHYDKYCRSVYLIVFKIDRIMKKWVKSIYFFHISLSGYLDSNPRS